MNINFLNKRKPSPDLKSRQKRLLSLFDMQGATVVAAYDDEDFMKRIKRFKNIRLTVVARKRTEFLEKIKYKEAQVSYSDFIDTTLDTSDFIFIKTDFNNLTELENNMLYAEKNLVQGGQLVLFDLKENAMDINQVRKILAVKFDRLQFIDENQFHVAICIK